VRVFREEQLSPFAIADGLTIWGAAFCGPTRERGFLDAGFSVDRGGVNLALFHGTERSGMPFEVAGKAAHGPFDARQIERSGLSHALVGHLHRPRDEAWFTYPGNPDPLTFGEDGQRGAVIVDVLGDGSIRRERRPVGVSRVHDLALDVSGATSLQDIRDRAAAVLAGKDGVARLTVHGELLPELSLDVRALAEVAHGLEQIVIRTGALSTAYDLAALALEPTVRGRFVRDVTAAADLDTAQRRRVLVTGLRALDGRSDLEVP
jgi:DNA repair exonuclease SbcCD nuclease subunit